MGDLGTWLRARWDDDERVAKESDKPDVYWYMDGHSPEAYAHITRWDPARVLAELHAKRILLDLHSPVRFGILVDTNCRTCKQPEPCSTVLVMAMPYADHPDYLGEWRPPQEIAERA